MVIIVTQISIDEIQILPELVAVIDFKSICGNNSQDFQFHTGG